MQGMLSVSVSIVLYHTRWEMLRKCLNALNVSVSKAAKEKPIGIKLYLVDNSVNDQYHTHLIQNLNQFYKVTNNITYQLIKSEANQGYGHGNNLAIKQIDSDYHIVMNPDVMLNEETLSTALNYMENHLDIGLLTPAVFGETGEQHYLCKKNPTLFDMFLRGFAPKFLQNFFSNRMHVFEMLDKDYGKEMIDVPFATGCFMLLRSTVLKKIGGFDERFFLYFEDADLSRRVLQISHTCYVPYVKILHKWARESRHNWKLKWVFICSAFKYWQKWGGIF